jgi:hypothetical protein
MSMHIFVSYAKGDIAVEKPERLRILLAVARTVTCGVGRVFVDELHNHGGGHAGVTRALDSATSFCLIRGPTYFHRCWTRWEYARAAGLSIPMYEIGIEDLWIRPMQARQVPSPAGWASQPAPRHADMSMYREEAC